jgi:hypothetical protein
MTDSLYKDFEDKKAIYHARHIKDGIFEYCKYCGTPIILKRRELWEKQNPHNWLSWKRVIIGRWWQTFDANDPNRKHKCKRQEQKNLEQWIKG